MEVVKAEILVRARESMEVEASRRVIWRWSGWERGDCKRRVLSVLRRARVARPVPAPRSVMVRVLGEVESREERVESRRCWRSWWSSIAWRMLPSVS